jgi:hypothetical protein
MHVRYSFVEQHKARPMKAEKVVQGPARVVVLGFLAMLAVTAAFVAVGGS